MLVAVSWQGLPCCHHSSHASLPGTRHRRQQASASPTTPQPDKLPLDALGPITSVVPAASSTLSVVSSDGLQAVPSLCLPAPRNRAHPISPWEHARPPAPIMTTGTSGSGLVAVFGKVALGPWGMAVGSIAQHSTASERALQPAEPTRSRAYPPTRHHGARRTRHGNPLSLASMEACAGRHSNVANVCRASKP